VVVLSVLSVHAVAESCPDPTKLENLCMMVGNRTNDSSGHNTYLYQTRIQQGACVSTGDSKDVRRRKVHDYLARYFP
jgi:hypothetical protein